MYTFSSFSKPARGFKNKTYKSKDWLIDVANQVKSRANNYQNQLQDCESKFKKKFFGIF